MVSSLIFQKFSGDAAHRDPSPDPGLPVFSRALPSILWRFAPSTRASCKRVNMSLQVNCLIQLLIFKIVYAKEILIAPEASFYSSKRAKIVSGWGSAPDPAGGTYSAPPDPLAVRGRGGEERGGEGKGRGGGLKSWSLLVKCWPLIEYGHATGLVESG